MATPFRPEQLLHQARTIPKFQGAFLTQTFQRPGVCPVSWWGVSLLYPFFVVSLTHGATQTSYRLHSLRLAAGSFELASVNGTKLPKTRFCLGCWRKLPALPVLKVSFGGATRMSPGSQPLWRPRRVHRGEHVVQEDHILRGEQRPRQAHPGLPRFPPRPVEWVSSAR